MARCRRQGRQKQQRKARKEARRAGLVKKVLGKKAIKKPASN